MDKYRWIRCLLICLASILVAILVTLEVADSGSGTPALRRIRIINTSSVEIEKVEVFSIEEDPDGNELVKTIVEVNEPIPSKHAHGLDADKDGFLHNGALAGTVDVIRVVISLPGGTTLTSTDLTTMTPGFVGVLIGLHDSAQPNHRDLAVVGFYGDDTNKKLLPNPDPLPTGLMPVMEQ